jgi:uncharacterized protein (TIGR02145 family)
MRLLLLIPIFLINTWYISAQSPNKMSFQAVIRDSTGGLVLNQSVGLRMSILQGSVSGSSVYTETHSPTTNSSGLISIEIGGGTTSDDFSSIDWSNGPYYLKREVDPVGGTNYTIIGTSQFLSVPYAMYTAIADTVLNAPDTSSTNEIQNLSVSITGDTLYISVGNYIIVPGISLNNNFGTVTSATGRIWMDRNLGASQVATSSTDTDSYGDLYQWGRATDGHQSRTSGTTSTNADTALANAGNSWDGLFILETSSPHDWLTPQDATLWQGVNGTNNPCPSGYRLPTHAEWETERMSWSSNNAAGAFASPLKLPVAGLRIRGDGSLSSVGSTGTYWSSTVSSTKVWYLSFHGSGAIMYEDTGAYGFSVRCIKD